MPSRFFLLAVIIFAQTSWAANLNDNPYKAPGRFGLAARGCQFASFKGAGPGARPGLRTAVLRAKKTGKHVTLVEDPEFASLSRRQEDESVGLKYSCLKSSLGVPAGASLAACSLVLTIVGFAYENPWIIAPWSFMSAVGPVHAVSYSLNVWRGWLALLQTGSFSEMESAFQAMKLAQSHFAIQSDFTIYYSGDFDRLLYYLVKWNKLFELVGPF